MLHSMFLRPLAATFIFLGPVLSIEAAVPPPSPAPAALSKLQISATMMRMPLQFEPNQGQVDAQVQFLARGKGYTLFLTPTETVMVLQQRDLPAAKDPLAMTDPTAVPEAAPMKQSVVRMKLEGSNPSPAIDGIEPLPGIVNYFIGNDPEKWHTKIPTYAKVQYKQAYPGIDLAYYGNQGRLEYDFIVAPGADPNQIKVAFEGPSDIRVAESGDLLLTTELGEVRMQKPVVYQLETDGHKTLVAGGYVVDAHATPLHASHTARYSVGFQLASYDHTKSVVIDPVLVYSTYLGGSSGDEGFGIAVDTTGQAYVTGTTQSTDFPTATPLQATNAAGEDAFVTKLNAAGTSLVYSTYLGGNSSDSGTGIAVDATGQAYVTGFTQSTDFPTATPLQGTNAGEEDAFVTKLNAAGTSLVYSTYFGGSGREEVRGIAVDGSNQAYITGFTNSTNFHTSTPLQATNAGSGDAFVTKFKDTGIGLVYSTYLGGSDTDQGLGIAVDGAGQAYVTGETYSTDFPTANPVQATLAGFNDAFVTKLNAAGSILVYSTYLGGSVRDSGFGITVDTTGQAYVTGETDSGDFPTATPLQATYAGGSDAFVTKLNAAGTSLLYSTYLGGSGGDQGRGLAVDGTGQAYVTGLTSSTNFPTATPLQATYAGGLDAFVTKLNAAGTSLRYSTYLGGSSLDLGNGIAVNATGQAYVTGRTNSTDFPTATPLQATNAGGLDAFVTKISDPSTNQLPVCSAAQANPASLWSPNGQFVPIVVTGVTDPDGDSVTISVTTVTQDEPVKGKSDKTSPDAVIQAGSASVRAERLNSGNGRVYQISFTADDGNGGSCTGAVKVGVPLNLKKGLNAIDDGQVYDSTIP